MTITTMKVADATMAPEETRKEISQWLSDLNRTAVITTVGENSDNIDQWLLSLGCEQWEDVLLNFNW